MEPDRWAWSPFPAPCQAWGPVGLTATHLEPPPPQELKLKDEECERLSKVREQLERELEELTASLFEVSWPAGEGGRLGNGSAGGAPAPRRSCRGCRPPRKPTRWCGKPT